MVRNRKTLLLQRPVQWVNKVRVKLVLGNMSRDCPCLLKLRSVGGMKASLITKSLENSVFLWIPVIPTEMRRILDIHAPTNRLGNSLTTAHQADLSWTHLFFYRFKRFNFSLTSGSSFIASTLTTIARCSRVFIQLPLQWESGA